MITQKDIEELNKKYNKWGLVWSDKTSNILFSDKDRIFVPIDPRSLIKQPNTDNELGLCLLTSLYNAFPNLFDYDILETKKRVKEYHNIVELKEYFKIIKYTQSDNFKTLNDIILQNFLNNLPIVLTTKFYLIPNNHGHAVALYGMSKDYLYYWENSEDDCLLNSLAMSYLQYAFKKRTSNSKFFKFFGTVFGDRTFSEFKKQFCSEFIDNNYKGKLQSISKKVLDTFGKDKCLIELVEQDTTDTVDELIIDYKNFSAIHNYTNRIRKIMLDNKWEY